MYRHPLFGLAAIREEAFPILLEADRLTNQPSSNLLSGKPLYPYLPPGKTDLLGKTLRSSFFSLLSPPPHSLLKSKPLAPPELTGLKAASFSALTFQRVVS